jgi:hypothetical protein
MRSAVFQTADCGRIPKYIIQPTFFKPTTEIKPAICFFGGHELEARASEQR